MGNVKNLLRQSSHYLIGRGFAVAIGLVSFPVWARLLTVADYGVLNLAQRFALFGVAVGKLGMQNAILRFHGEASQSEDSLNRLYSTCWYGSLLGAFVCAGLCAAFFTLPTANWIQPNIALALLVTSGLIFMRSAASPLFGFLRVEGRSVAYNVVDILGRALSLVLGVALVLTRGKRPEIMLVGLIAAEAITIVISLIFFVPRQRLRLKYFDSTLLRSALVFAIPLAGSELAQILLTSADRGLIQYYLGSVPLGYYAGACTIAIVLQDTLQLPLNMALVPIYMKLWHSEGAEATSRFVSHTLDMFLIAACGVCAVVFVVSHELVIVVNSPKFAPAAPMVGPLVAGYMCIAASVFLSAGFWVRKKTTEMARLVAIAVVVKTILNILLLPKLGIWGAVIPVLVAYPLMMVLYGWYSHKLLPLRLSPLRCVAYLGAAVVASFLGKLIVIQSLAASLVVRSIATAAAYGILLWLVDSRIREFSRKLAGKAYMRISAA